MILENKTGFRITNPYIPVIIKDMRGMLFYDNREISIERKHFFNLPAGRYELVSGKFEALPYPVKWPMFNLPDKQRNYDSPIDFDVKLGNNPHKCSVFWDHNLILFDNSLFRRWPIPVIYFVYGHELGHRYFGVEDFADWYAHNFMISRGFNPSQIGMSPMNSLSKQQYRRISGMIYKIVKENAK